MSTAQYIGTKEAANLAGCSISGMRNKCGKGEIPGVIRYDARYRIDRAELLAWIESKRVMAAAAPQPAPDPLYFPILEQFRSKNPRKAK